MKMGGAISTGELRKRLYQMQRANLWGLGRSNRVNTICGLSDEEILFSSTRRAIYLQTPQPLLSVYLESG